MQTSYTTQVLKTTSEKAVSKACNLLKKGELVAIATETVYGLAGDATNHNACANIYATKDRPSFNPLIIHVADLIMAQRVGIFSDIALHLAETYWPGALTLVVPLRSDKHRIPITSLVTAGLDTVAIRIPARQNIRDLIQTFGRPLAAPSANPSGRLSPTTADHVLQSLGGKIPLIMDDGPCAVGIESTIVDTTENPLTILRSGGIANEDIAKTVEHEIRCASHDNTTPKSPGMLTSHYAPRLPVRLNVTHPKDTELMLGFAGVKGHMNLSPSGDLTESASNLFDFLHKADNWNATHGTNYTGIAVAPIPNTGLGIGINDRLSRASS